MFHNNLFCMSIGDNNLKKYTCFEKLNKIKVVLCFWKLYKYMKNTNIINHISKLQHKTKCVINKIVITVCQHTCSDINMPSNSSISTYSFRYQHTLSFAHDTAVIISTNIIKLVSITKWYRNIHVEYQHTSWWNSIN